MLPAWNDWVWIAPLRGGGFGFVGHENKHASLTPGSPQLGKVDDSPNRTIGRAREQSAPPHIFSGEDSPASNKVGAFLP